MQIQYINNLRAAACVLVILTHSAMPALELSYGIYMAFFSLVASPSSELFVTISSSLLAPTKQDMFAFYRRRFMKLLPPFFFWSMVILIIGLFKSGFDLELFAKKLLLFPISPVTGVYWFVYAISGLYFLIPLVSPWLENTGKKGLIFVISLWFLTLLFPYLNILLGQDFYHIAGDYYFILVYFGGFLGYLFLGVYLRKYPLEFNSKTKAFGAVSVLVLIGSIPVVFGYLFDKENLNVYLDNLSITSCFYVIAIFCFFQNFKLPNLLEHVVNAIAKHSYGIYLIHIIVIRDVIWKVLENHRLPHPIIETPIITLLAVIICYAIIKAMSYLPKSKYIVGV